MSLPPGFKGKHGHKKVCRLRKSLYGLKQSPKALFERFDLVTKCMHSPGQEHFDLVNRILR